MRAGAASDHIFENGDPPAVLAQADGLVQSLIDALITCQPNAALRIDAGCNALDR
ncbi:MAG: hypothetical protein ACI9U2_004451 [Bradymonadia bacterium]